MPRNRRLISPAVACGTCLLAVFTAVVLAGTLRATSNTVAGTALPRAEPAPTVRAQAPAPPPIAEPRGSSETSTPSAPGTPEAAPKTTQRPKKPAIGQALGTVRLAHGGTASLVRREVGIDGVLPIPNAINQATWWGAGLRGPTGATVLAGHVNWRGVTGPFAELWDSVLGDRVSVVDQAGQTVSYRVTRIVTLGKDELPKRAQELFAQSGPHRLVLVTCGGRWIGGDTGYASNQIVIATPT
jgi:hypothetical protein